MSGDMNNFIDPYSTSTENGDSHAMHNGHDEMGSQSGSDEGSSTVHYADSFRNDGDFDDDPDALTSQTLNADGTPKRPMNAFMIFARKRRPQVSAENQAMRTGEISKILSKEWAMMPPSEKQFYLDRAKQLKETFNNKYPDYVYRRRPNNSRKKSKRRLDTGMCGAVDHRSTPEASEDFGNASCDYNDSHREGEDRRYETGPGVLHTRLHHDYIGATQPRSHPYAYVQSDTPYRHENPHEARVPLLPSQPERLQNDVPHRISHSDIYNYPGQSQPAQLYSASPAETHDRWDSRIGPGRSGWMHERSVPISTPRYGAGAPTGWSNSVSATSTTATSGSAQPGSYSFPTLTSPFYPTQAHLQNYQTTASPSDSPARYESPANQGQQNTASRDYDSQSYNPSPVTSANPYPDDAVIYQHRLAIPRGLPPVQSLASYSHSPHPGGSGASAPQGY